MKRVNIKSAFVGEPTASQEGLEAEDDQEAVMLAVRGGEVTLVVPSGTPGDDLVRHCSVLRGSLRLENERVLTFEIQESAVGAFFEDEPTHLHDRRDEEGAVGLFSGPHDLAADRPRLARDIMTQQPLSVGPGTPVKQVAELLAFHGISGLLVEDGERLLGVVTEADVISKSGQVAADIMTREVVSVSEDTPIPEVAALLARHRIKRVPVVQGDRAVGVISRADLVRWIAQR